MRTKPLSSLRERIDCNIDPEVALSLRDYCNRKGRSLGDVVNNAVANYLKVANHYHGSGRLPPIARPKGALNLAPKPCPACDGEDPDCERCGGVGVYCG